MSIIKKAKRVFGKIVVVLVNIIFYSTTLFLMYYVVTAAFGIDYLNKKCVDACITEVTELSQTVSDKDGTSVETTYRFSCLYSYGGVEYTILEGSDHKKTQGQTIYVYIDPRNPLLADYRGDWARLAAIFLALCLALAIPSLIVIFGSKKRKKSKEKARLDIKLE